MLRPSVQLPAGIHGCAPYKDFGRHSKGKRCDGASGGLLIRQVVMPGLVPGIHVFGAPSKEDVDGRDI